VRILSERERESERERRRGERTCRRLDRKSYRHARPYIIIYESEEDEGRSVCIVPHSCFLADKTP